MVKLIPNVDILTFHFFQINLYLGTRCHSMLIFPTFFRLQFPDEVDLTSYQDEDEYNLRNVVLPKPHPQ